MQKLTVISFYKYVNLRKIKSFRREHQDFCDKLGVKGKVLVSKEGINGSVSGTNEQITKYKRKIKSYNEFKNITFKDATTTEHPFKKTIVRIRPEIVASNFNINLKYAGSYIASKELKKMYENKEDFIILDARNDYEWKIGKFKNAITLSMDIFKDFPKKIQMLEKFKKKKIIMYCTGGVRCEKASAVLRQKGFEDVNQLKDGIIKFIEEYPDTYFEGRCFVFDDRLSVPSGKNTKEIALCEKCHIPYGEYKNCTNKKCDRLYLMCNSCREQYENMCSKRCRSAVKLRGNV